MYRQIRALYEKKGYQWREGGRVNICGVRCQRTVTDRFDDFISLGYDDASHPDGGKVVRLQATTRASRYYFQNPMNAKGCAVLPPGQYLDTWAFGLHNGKYEALLQVRPITLWRDGNKDDEVDETNPDTGLFGINIHRAVAGGVSNEVGPFSAGCQVIASAADFDAMMKVLHANADRFGNKYWDYTLFTLQDAASVSGL